MTFGCSCKISVGLPVYNGEQFLDAALSSLIEQTERDIEIIVSDNHSSDGTEAISRRFAERDPRIVYVRNDRNVGAAANYNNVVSRARGRYFVWACHDDVWAPTYLAECSQALDRTPAAVLAYARGANIDAMGEVIAPLVSGFGFSGGSPVARLRQLHRYLRDVDRRGGWSEPGCEGFWATLYGVIRTDRLRRTGLIGPFISSDTVLLEELLMLGSFVEVPQTLFFKRDHPERSVRANLAYDSRLLWFLGREGGRFLFPRHRILWERLRAVLRLPLRPDMKARCAAEMLAFYVRRPAEGFGLAKEIVINLARVFKSRRLAGFEKW